MVARVVFTDRTAGSFAIDGDQLLLAERRAAVVDAPFTWLRQVHGATCVVVTEPGAHAGVEADAAVTAVPGAVLSVISADCAPVVLVADRVVGAAHAGWRGLVAGVLPATVDAMRTLGAEHITAHLGPCIRHRCYEFAGEDLDHAVAVLGDHVRATTAWDTPALDVTAGVASSLATVGVTDVRDDGVCTACSPVHWSWRARQDRGRQAAMTWLVPQ